MSSLPFRGPSYLILSAVLIVVLGLGVLMMGLTPTSETEERSEFRMDEGGLSAWQFPEVDFDAEMSITVDFDTAPRKEDSVAFYVVDEDEYDRFREWVEEENVTEAMKRIEDLEFIYETDCSADCSFDLRTEQDGDLYIIVMNNGEEQQEFTITVKSTSGIEFGVCCGVFLLLVLIAGLVIRASLRIEDERMGRSRRF